jgi:adenylate cyclase
MTETLTPERTVALLRSFYRRVAKAIFERGGSIENFSGESLMALFGIPAPPNSTPPIPCIARST